MFNYLFLEKCSNNLCIFTSGEGTPLFRGKETSIQCLPPSFDKKSTHHRDFLFSAELSEHITM